MQKILLNFRPTNVLPLTINRESRRQRFNEVVRYMRDSHRPCDSPLLCEYTLSTFCKQPRQVEQRLLALVRKLGAIPKQKGTPDTPYPRYPGTPDTSATSETPSDNDCGY